MTGVFIRVLIGCGLALGVIGAQAQTDNELLSWQFIQQLDVPNTAATDRYADVMFADNLLLVASPGLQIGDCGRVLVFAENVNRRYRLVQELGAADFGSVCAGRDAFGFSMAFADGRLFIGAPGSIFTLTNPNFPRLSTLPAGEVFAYVMDGDSFIPQQRITGPDTTGNQAWGTQVETDGVRLLIQGNEPDTPLSVQGFANPRSVNLLVQSANGDWVPSQVFTESRNDITTYGQDFDINESAIFIGKHDFMGDFSLGFISNRVRYDSTLEIYSIDDAADGVVSATPDQIIFHELEIYNDVQTLPAVNYVAAQNGSFNLYRSPTPPIFLNETRFTSHAGYRLENGIWVDARSGIGFPFSFFGDPFLFRSDLRHEIGRLADFTPDNTYRVAPGDSGQLIVETINTPLLRGRLVRRERFINADRVSAAVDQEVRVNNNRLLLVRRSEDESRRIQIDVFNAIPALDPAITQAWWFGPDFDGQGVTFEVLANNRLLMHWFTYDLSGNQMWLRGVGQLANGEINMELRRPMGPSFTFGEFDPDDRVVEVWGRATVRFDDCTSGILSYASDEFGNGELPLMPLVNNRLQCNSGRIIGRSFRQNLGASNIAGSFFDPQRSGEGIILMPIPRMLGAGNDGTSRADRVVGLWLTYTPTGEQAWYYLGIYEECGNTPQGNNRRCRLLATQTPRSTTGPIFGPAYDPDDRISMPWGEASQILLEARGRDFRQLSLFVDNPDGTGTLLLQQSTRPIGYVPL